MYTTKSISSIVEEWQSNLAVSDLTRREYHYQLNFWFRYLARNGRPADAAGNTDVANYRRELESKGYSEFTICSYITVVKLFYKYCEQQKYCEAIGKNVKSTTQMTYYHKRPLSEDEMRVLMQSIDLSRVKGTRDALIIALMMFSGLRCCEVSRMNFGDFETLEGVKIVNIQRKGHREKDNFCVLPRPTLRLFKLYKNDVENISDDINNIPIAISFNHKNRYKIKRLSALEIGRTVKKRLQGAGIDNKKISAHSLRHSYACYLITHGVEDETVRALLGHANVNTTRIYMKLAQDQMLLHHNPGVHAIDNFFNKQ